MGAMRAKGTPLDLRIRRFENQKSVRFVVLGNTGERGYTQYYVIPPLTAAAGGADFLYICGNVMHPAGDVHEYETKFYYPYRWFDGPIYAIPGRNDWYDGLHGFMRHFCGARPEERPRASPVGSRLQRFLRWLAWRRPPRPNEKRIERARALRPRFEQQANQPGSYFALDAGPVLLVGVDTGMAGVIDAEQAQWLLEISRVEKPKILLSGRPLYVNGIRWMVQLEGFQTSLNDVVDDPAHQYIAVIGGAVHNYQRYPVKQADGRTIMHMTSGAGGAYAHATHKIPKISLEDSTEQDWRCYPRRGDSLAAYSNHYARRFRSSGRWLVPVEEAPAIVAERLGDSPHRVVDQDRAVSAHSRRAADRLWRRPGRGRTARFDWDDPPPPLFRSFLSIEVAPGSVDFRCLAATGCAKHENETVIEDFFQYKLGLENWVGAPKRGGYRLLLDVPSETPALNFNETARVLAETIQVSNPRFAIGIFGGWGSGKTTLMQAIESHLDESRSIAVRFSAWRYEKEEHLIVPLLDTIRQSLVEWSDRHPEARKEARRTASAVGKAMRSILAGVSMRIGVPGGVELSFDANKALEARRKLLEDEAAVVSRSFYHASFRALEAAFERFVGENPSRRIVIFVDDLDRCLPESALQVLESMKLFFDLPGFVFVVGLDQEIVEYVIDAKYGRDAVADGGGSRRRTTRVSGADYVKKIFQLPFRLPPVTLEQLDEFLRKTYQEAGLEDAQRGELDRVVKPHLAYLFGDSPVNPREIKRYINAYTVATLVDEDLDPDTLLAVQTIIRFREDWSIVRDALLQYRQLCVELISDQDWSAVSVLDPELSLPDDFIDYVLPDNPGHGLLAHAEDIDRYISSGEAVTSGQDPRLLEAIRGVGGVRRTLYEGRVRGRINLRALRGSSEALKRVRSLVPTSNPLAARIIMDTDAFEEQLQFLESQSPEDAQIEWSAADPLLQGLEATARVISQRLLRLYRAEEVPISEAGAVVPQPARTQGSWETLVE
jgi:hypothetical protein